jgi:hypothetical protein
MARPRACSLGDRDREGDLGACAGQILVRLRANAQPEGTRKKWATTDSHESVVAEVLDPAASRRASRRARPRPQSLYGFVVTTSGSAHAETPLALTARTLKA